MQVVSFSLALWLLCCVGFSHQEDRAALMTKAKQVSEKCEADNGIPKDVPRKAFTERKFPEDKNFKCYLKCVYEGLEFASDGKINIPKVEGYLLPINKKKILEGLRECNEITGEEPCDTMYKVAMCGQKVVEPYKHH